MSTSVTSVQSGLSAQAVDSKCYNYRDRFKRFLDNTVEPLLLIQESEKLAKEITSSTDPDNDFKKAGLDQAITRIVKELRPFYYSQLSAEDQTKLATAIEKGLSTRNIQNNQNPFKDSEGDVQVIVQAALKEVNPGLSIEINLAYTTGALLGAAIGSPFGLLHGFTSASPKGAEMAISYASTKAEKLSLPLSIILSTALGLGLGYQYDLDYTFPLLVAAACLAVVASSYLLDRPINLILSALFVSIGAISGAIGFGLHEAMSSTITIADLSGKAAVPILTGAICAGTYPVRGAIWAASKVVSYFRP